MKLSSLFSVVLFVSITGNTYAETAIAPEHRIRIWKGPASLPDSEFTIGFTTAMGEVKTLKSTPLVIDILTNRKYINDTGGLDLIREPGAKLHSKSWAGGEHQSISDKGTYDSNGTSRQCVAFARSMTGTKKSPYWYPGTPLTQYLQWNGIGYIKNPWSITELAPGTMIAHFRGKSKYPTSVPPWGHVAIFLDWSYDKNGYIDGVYVVDQNLTESISVNGIIVDNADGMIQKHRLPWVCTAGKACGTGKYFTTFFASGYHVVDVR